MQFLIAVWCLNLGAEVSDFFLRDSTRDIDGVGYVGLDMLSITVKIVSHVQTLAFLICSGPKPLWLQVRKVSPEKGSHRCFCMSADRI